MMTAAQIGELVGAGVAVLIALSAWLKAHTAQKTAAAAVRRSASRMEGIDK